LPDLDTSSFRKHGKLAATTSRVFKCTWTKNNDVSGPPTGHLNHWKEEFKDEQEVYLSVFHKSVKKPSWGYDFKNASLDIEQCLKIKLQSSEHCFLYSCCKTFGQKLSCFVKFKSLVYEILF